MWTGEGSAPNSPVTQLTSGVTATRNAPGWKQLGPEGIRIYPHPVFDRDDKRLDHDIALIRVLLPESMDLPDLYVPDRLPELDTTGALGWQALPQSSIGSLKIIGFGMQRRPPAPPSSTLQEANAARFSSLFTLPGKIRVVGVTPDGRTPSEIIGTCQGDSGGPLLRYINNRTLVSGPLCCGFCANETVTDEQLKTLPASYSAVGDYINPPTGFFAANLPSTSPWQKGILKIVADASPTQIRTTTVVSPTPTTDITDEERTGNHWVEKGISVSQWSRWLNWILYYIRGLLVPILIGAGIIVLLTVAYLAARHRRKTRNRSLARRSLLADADRGDEE